MKMSLYEIIIIILAILQFISLGTFVLLYKKISNKITQRNKNKIMWLIIILLSLYLTLSFFYFYRGLIIEQYKIDLSKALTENKGLKIDLSKYNESENPMEIQESYPEFGDDVDNFQQNKVYNLSWKLRSSKDLDVWISAYVKSVSVDKKNKPELYVPDDDRNIQIKKLVLETIPLVLDTKDASVGAYYSCLRVIDSSKKKQNIPTIEYDECKSTFVIR